MGDVTFAVESREGTGKGVARQLRLRGMAPGVVYGGGRKATAIAFDIAGLEQLLSSSHGGLNTLIDLEGNSEATGRTVIAKELQREAIRGEIIHVDFYEINLTEKIHVSVPIHLEGTPAGVVLGGVLDQQLRELELLCLPNAIPDDIRIDVSDLELGDSLHVSQLSIPDGVELAIDAELTVATVVIPRGLKEDDADGASAEGGDGAETADDDADGDKEKSDDQ